MMVVEAEVESCFGAGPISSGLDSSSRHHRHHRHHQPLAAADGAASRL